MRPPQTPHSPTTVRALGAACLGLMAAALFWLAASSRLAAIGVQMDWLREHRTMLLQERSEALARYAAATNPDAMERRAARLGLRPADPERMVVVSSPLGRSGEGGLGRVLVARRGAVGVGQPMSGPTGGAGDRGIGAELAAAAAQVREHER